MVLGETPVNKRKPNTEQLMKKSDKKIQQASKRLSEKLTLGLYLGTPLLSTLSTS